MKTIRQLLVLAGLCAAAVHLPAQTVLTWTGIGDDGLFGTAENWSPMQSPGGLDTVQFGPIGPIYTNVQFASEGSVGNIEFLDTRDVDYHLLPAFGTASLMVGGNVTVATGANVFFDPGLNLTLTSGEHVFSVATAADLISISGVISGPGHFTKTGDGTLALTGLNTFNYDGEHGFTNSTAIKAGTLLLDGGTINHTGTGDITIGDTSGDNGTLLIYSGAVASDYFGVIAQSSGSVGYVTVGGAGSIWNNSAGLDVGYGGDATLNLVSGGVVNVTGSQSIIAYGGSSSGLVWINGVGSAWNNAGDIVVGAYGSGDLTVLNGGKVQSNSGTGNIILGANGGSGILNIGFPSNGTAEGGGIVNAASVTTGTGSGTVQFNTTADVDNRYYFTNDGTETGTAITIDGATQLINSAGYTVLTGTNLYTGGTSIAGGYLLLGYYGTTGSIIGDVTFTGNVNAGGGELQFLRSDNYTFGGNINGPGRVSNFGDGILSLAGSNTYSGDTFVGAGALADSVEGAWSPNSVLRIDSSATLLPAFNETIAGLNDYTTGVSGGVDFGTNTAVLTLNVSSAVTFAGSIAGDGSLAKTGSGVQELTGASSYTGGTVVNGGTLAVNSGSINHPSADVTVGDGDSDNGTLEISNAGGVTNDNSLVGNGSGSSGTVTVDGSGSTWTSASNLFVGQFGDGSVSVMNGGTVLSQFGYVGTQTGGTGLVEVDGIFSSWSISSGLFIGDNGTGELKVSNGGLVADVTGHIGYSAGSIGCADITGTYSAWNNSGALLVGLSGTGDLKIASGATVTDTDGTLASLAGSIGTALVTGAGSNWNNSGYLYVGGAGNGTLDVENGGYVYGANVSIGNNTGGTGALTVDGSGSQLSVDNTLYVGSAGSGTLNVTNGGSAFSSVGSVGNNAGGIGDVTVSDAGSTWYVSNQLLVGNATSGALGILNGGNVTAYYLGIGVLSGVSGSAYLANNSTLDVGNDTMVGGAGAGDLGILSGSDVTTVGNGIIGNTGTGSSQVTIDGVGSTWTIGGNAYVGNGSTGSLFLLHGGKIDVGSGSGTISLGHSGAWGRVYIGYDGEATTPGGIINAAAITTESGSGDVIFGTASNSSSPYYLTKDGTSGGAPVLIAGPTVVSVESGYNVLTGANTYTGGTTIYSGTLVMGNNSALGTGAVTVYGGSLSVASGITFSNPLNLAGSGGRLGGNGTFGSLVTVGNGVHLAPGNSPGTLTFSSGLTLTDGGFLDMEVQAAAGAAGTGYDTVVVSGGALDLAAVSAGGFTLKLISLNLGGSAGDVSDFNFTNSYSWTVFSTTGITGFNANKFALDLSGFSNDISIGSFVVAQSGNSVLLNFTAVPEPSTWALLALGLAGGGLAGWRRARRRA